MRRAIAIVTRVIGQNRTLAEGHPSHRMTAERRIREGEDELAMLGEQEQKLKQPPE